jgi:hypothetical protein
MVDLLRGLGIRKYGTDWVLCQDISVAGPNAKLNGESNLPILELRKATTMRKHKPAIIVVFVIFTVNMMTVSSASAAHQWLKNGAAAIVTPQLAITDGLLLFHHEGWP